MAVVLVLSIPFAVLQTAIADKTATLRVAGRDGDVTALAASALKTIVPLGWAVAAAVLFVCTPLLSFFLHVGIGSALLLPLYVAASIPVSVAFGVLQGQLRFQALAGLVVASVVFRLVLGVALVWAGLGVAGALLASVLAMAFAIPLAFRLVLVDRAAWRSAPRTLAALRGQVGAALYGLTSFWILAEVDIALARHYLGSQASGYYSSAGLMARALLFFPAAVGVVAFPRFVATRADPTVQMRWLRVSVAAVAALGVVGSTGLVLLREPLVLLAFGHRFLPAASLLPVLAPAMACFAVVNVLAYFHIAAGSRAYLISLAGIAVEALAIALLHADGHQIAVIVAVVSFGVALLQYQAAHSIGRWHPRFQRLRDGPDAPALWRAATLELSVVLPCHNAAPGLRAVLTTLLDRLEQLTTSYEIIVVSDGSTDETVAIAESIGSSAVRVISHPTRSGKGHALQLGLSDTQGEYIAFCDADGDIDAGAIEPFLALMKLYEPDVVLGSKRHPLSEVYYPPVRRLLSWVYHKLARLLFRVSVTDTQTGFKLIRRDVLAAVLPRLLEKRYAFDLEFLVVARSLGFKRILEAPVRIHYRFASQVNLRASAAILVDTLAIFYRYYILNTYRQVGDRQGPVISSPSLEGSSRIRRRENARILLLNWRDIENPEAGGAEVFTHELARRWADQGHDVTLLASGFRGSASSAELDGVHVRRLGRLRTGSFHARVQRELMRASGFDLVVESINTIPFLTPIWRHRLPPTITLVHQLAIDVWDAELPRPLAWLGRRAERSLLHPYRDAPVVAVSNSTRADLLELGFTDVSVVSPGRDAPSDVRGLPKEPVPTFLFVGRLAANKRPDHAVEAFRAIKHALPDARLWIVGRGPLERELTNTLPPDATLLGRLPRGELYERMARAHCLLVPSVREGWGLVVIEANSVGTPAVGYDVPGVRDSILAGRTGLLATAGAPEALGDQAVSLLDDEARYLAVQRAAIAWAKRFSWDTTAAELINLAFASADGEPVDGSVEAVAAGVW